jgi:hypothetical protein
MKRQKEIEQLKLLYKVGFQNIALEMRPWCQQANVDFCSRLPVDGLAADLFSFLKRKLWM